MYAGAGQLGAQPDHSLSGGLAEEVGGCISHTHCLEEVNQQLATLEGRDVGDGLVLMEGASNRLKGGVHLCRAASVLCPRLCLVLCLLLCNLLAVLCSGRPLCSNPDHMCPAATWGVASYI